MSFRLIHFGIGGRGRHWLDFIATRSDFESVACVDVDEKALGEIERERGCRVFTEFAQALAEVEADGVLIASPSLLHGKHARQALEAGFAVMVEKPLAASLDEAVEVVECARAAGRALMVAENYRFFRAERTLKKCLDEQRIGRVLSAVCIDRRDQPSRTQGSWVKSMEQPFLTEIAVHHFDSFRYLFGCRPVSVWAETYNPPGSDYERNGAAQSLIEMEDGLPIQYSGSFVGSRYEYRLWIRGERGELVTDRSRVWCREPEERRYRELAPVSIPDGEPLRYPQAGMLSMLGQFRDAVTQGTTPETSGADNLWTLSMFDAAVRAAREHRYVAVDEVLTPDLKVRAGISQGAG